MATQPTLGGSPLGILHNLPTTKGTFPSADGGYTIKKEYRGGSYEMANGSMTVDLVQSGLKRVVTFAWQHISETARDNIDSALASMGTGSATLVIPEGDSFNVTLNLDLTLPTWISTPGADGNMYYSGSVVLREV